MAIGAPDRHGSNPGSVQCTGRDDSKGVGAHCGTMNSPPGNCWQSYLSSDYRIAMAESGVEALEKARELRPERDYARRADAEDRWF